MPELKTDPEFESLIPTMATDEFQQLEANILAINRCKDPLTTWNGLLVDGHHRLKIIKKHGITDYRVEPIELDSREDAIIWMCQNQRGRRHSTDEQKQYLLGKEYEATKQKEGRASKDEVKKRLQNEDVYEKGRTVEKMAKLHGIGRSTVERSGQFAQGIDKIANESPAAKQKILSGQTGLTKTEVREIRNKPVEEVREIAKQIESGTYERPRPAPKQEAIPPPQPELPAPESEPEADWATRKKQIAQHVAELKDDSIDRSLTSDMVIAEHDYFVRQTLLSFERYKTDLYRTAYARMNEDEKEKVIALNNVLLGAIKKNNIHLKG